MLGFIEYALQFEGPLAVLVIFAIAYRAQRRGVNKWLYVTLAAVGFVALGLTSRLGLGLWAVLLRWMWVGGVLVYVVRFTRGGRQMRGNWQCPTCLAFNDPTTLKCTCGYSQPVSE